eukprot:PLAT10364.1.p3 GENE.PLAT10364.1~~PLAT10364.1.p3  ORF type:complete len:177 (-),score=83.86 PLAT10364.1:128-658(-)
MATISVKDDGNPGICDSADDARQAVLDIVNFFYSHPESEDLRDVESVRDAEVEAFTKTWAVDVPAVLLMLLDRHDGGVLFEEHKLMSLKAIDAALDAESKKGGWPEGAIPFAVDEDENFLVILPGGGLAEWDVDDGEMGREKYDSLTLYLTNFRDSLLMGKFEVIEGPMLIAKLAK